MVETFVGLAMSKEIEEQLKEITEEIFTDMFQVEKYAGTAFCTETEDESESRFWKGQYVALKRTRQNIETRMFRMIMKREKEEE